LAKRDERSASWQVKCILAPGYVLSICSRVLTASYCPRKREPGPADPLRIGRASGEHRASSRFRLIGRPGRLSRRPADRRPGPPTQLSAPEQKRQVPQAARRAERAMALCSASVAVGPNRTDCRVTEILRRGCQELAAMPEACSPRERVERSRRAIMGSAAGVPGSRKLS
jgi:hypothetical protein